MRLFSNVIIVTIVASIAAGQAYAEDPVLKELKPTLKGECGLSPGCQQKSDEAKKAIEDYKKAKEKASLPNTAGGKGQDGAANANAENWEMQAQHERDLAKKMETAATKLDDAAKQAKEDANKYRAEDPALAAELDKKAQEFEKQKEAAKKAQTTHEGRAADSEKVAAKNREIADRVGAGDKTPPPKDGGSTPTGAPEQAETPQPKVADVPKKGGGATSKPQTTNTSQTPATDKPELAGGDQAAPITSTKPESPAPSGDTANREIASKGPESKAITGAEETSKGSSPVEKSQSQVSKGMGEIPPESGAKIPEDGVPEKGTKASVAKGILDDANHEGSSATESKPTTAQGGGNGDAPTSPSHEPPAPKPLDSIAGGDGSKDKSNPTGPSGDYSANDPKDGGGKAVSPALADKDHGTGPADRKDAGMTHGRDGPADDTHSNPSDSGKYASNSPYENGGPAKANSGSGGIFPNFIQSLFEEKDPEPVAFDSPMADSPKQMASNGMGAPPEKENSNGRSRAAEKGNKKKSEAEYNSKDGKDVAYANNEPPKEEDNTSVTVQNQETLAKDSEKKETTKGEGKIASTKTSPVEPVNSLISEEEEDKLAAKEEAKGKLKTEKTNLLKDGGTKALAATAAKEEKKEEAKLSMRDTLKNRLKKMLGMGKGEDSKEGSESVASTEESGDKNALASLRSGSSSRRFASAGGSSRSEEFSMDPNETAQAVDKMLGETESMGEILGVESKGLFLRVRSAHLRFSQKM